MTRSPLHRPGDVVEIAIAGGHVIIDATDEELFLCWPCAWFVDTNGYVSSSMMSGERRIKVKLHRILLGFPKLQVDHRNGSRLDNRRDNLRLATNAQNSANRKTQKHGCQFKGVSRTRHGTYAAQITKRPNKYWLGCFATEIEAALAYDTKAIELFGEFARPNFPMEAVA